MENNDKISSSTTKAVIEIIHSVDGMNLNIRDEEPYQLIKTLLYRSNIPQHMFNSMNIEVLTLPFNLFYKKYGDCITPYNEDGKRGGLYYITTTSHSSVITNGGSENECDDDDIEHFNDTVSILLKVELCKYNNNDCLSILLYTDVSSYMEAVDIIHSDTDFSVDHPFDKTSALKSSAIKSFATIIFLTK